MAWRSTNPFISRTSRIFFQPSTQKPTAVIKGENKTADGILSEYYDVLTKVEHTVGERSTLSLNALLAYDDLAYVSEDFESFERVRADYMSYHLWFNLRTAWTENLVSRTILSSGAVRVPVEEEITPG